MEYEKKFWLNSKVPTGFNYSRPKRIKPRAIHESEYERLKDLRDEGKSPKELALLFGCSKHSVISTLKHIDPKP